MSVFEQDLQALYFGSMPVEHIFLTEYMPAARGDYVKVYLWGLYACQNRGPEYSLDEMAQELFMTVPDIEAVQRKRVQPVRREPQGAPLGDLHGL